MLRISSDRPSRRLKKSRFQPILLNMSEQENNPLKGLENYQQVYENLEESGWSQVWMVGKRWVVPDVPRAGAAKMYRNNSDGCRDLWKSSYRQKKERRINR
jgi:saccharopine dehydrogenase-like NADP-dependent oxidoreductase